MRKVVGILLMLGGTAVHAEPNVVTVFGGSTTTIRAETETVVRCENSATRLGARCVVGSQRAEGLSQAYYFAAVVSPDGNYQIYKQFYYDELHIESEDLAYRNAISKRNQWASDKICEI